MLKSSLKYSLYLIVFSLFFQQNSYAQEGTVTVNQDRNINKLLDLKKQVNSTKVNYRIQIYNGNRAGAEKARTDFRKVFSEWKADMKFQTPNYKIWVGKFKTRIEADRALMRIKKEFSSSFIFKPKKE